MSQRQKHRVYIVVHKGDPLDYQKYRHTAVWVVPADGSAHYYCHVVGKTGDFSYEQRINYNPKGSRTFAKLIDVGETRTLSTTSEFTKFVKGTPVKKDDPEFNCQSWVDDAVSRMYRAGYLTKKEYEEGTDAMLDATMEAGDEPEPK